VLIFSTNVISRNWTSFTNRSINGIYEEVNVWRPTQAGTTIRMAEWRSGVEPYAAAAVVIPNGGATTNQFFHTTAVSTVDAPSAVLATDGLMVSYASSYSDPDITTALFETDVIDSSTNRPQCSVASNVTGTALTYSSTGGVMDRVAGWTVKIDPEPATIRPEASTVSTAVALPSPSVIGETRSVSLFVKPTTLSGEAAEYDILLEMDETGEIRLFGDGKIRFVLWNEDVSAGISYTVGAPIVAGAWSHVLVGVEQFADSRSQVRITINGVSGLSTLTPDGDSYGDRFRSSDVYTIGWDNADSGSYVSGSKIMAGITWFDREATPAERALMYEYGVGLNTISPTTLKVVDAIDPNSLVPGATGLYVIRDNLPIWRWCPVELFR